jgi:hypothetical protein
MMRPWVSILPLFVVRRLAMRYGARFTYSYGSHKRVFVMATRDCFFKDK